MLLPMGEPRGPRITQIDKMDEKKPPTGKTLAWMYGIVVSFVTVYVVGGILLEKVWRK